MEIKEMDMLERIQRYLNNKIWLGISLVLFFYVLILIFSTGIFARIVGTNFYQENLYLGFIFRFVILCLYFFLIVPFLFNVPYSDMSFIQYLKNVKLAKYRPIISILVIGLLTSGITVGCIALASVLTTLSNGGYDFSWFIFLKEKGPVLYTATIPGIFEELAFRGIVLTLLIKKYKEKGAIIISTILFSSFHLINLINIIYQSSETVSIIINVAFQLIYTAAIGFFFGYVTLKTKSIIPAIICHYIVDSFGQLFQLVYNVNEIHFLIWQTFVGIGLLPAILNILLIKIIPTKWLEVNKKQEKIVFPST